MSVFTTVHEHQLTEFLQQFDAGTLQSFEGIAAGIENTNYFVTTDRYTLVLTLFEHHQPDELGYFLDLMAFLAEHDVPTAHPLPTRDGSFLSTLNGKPAALVKRLSGRAIERPSARACRTVGEVLAGFHRASGAFPEFRTPDRALPWAQEMQMVLADHLNAADRALLDEELALQVRHPRTHLPQGAIHGDLFRDNVLFSDERLTGIIDLYYACNDAFAYDLAVAINDWCRSDDHGLDEARAHAMMQGYLAVRPLNPDETEALPLLFRAAALRFWLSRMKDLCFPRAGELTFSKDPAEFRTLLLHHRQDPTATQRWIAA
ncbi:homoserine kinase [Halothiobacillus diazotrophicus]|uniref:Homoserine kinase n=1 Tax=Halothiobacillus diazotrophicus TaxID=1860122 RepID=A0A191ZGG6_9GAMM|nr:homoserine kinase [Halothiobacillus diazotrophicus]ANJ66958.1 homoserine kinase [Halothiobacillus diazotrophicus]